MIYSVVTMIIKKGKMEDFLNECKRIRPFVLKESGCLMYDYTRELKIDSGRQEPYNENRITLYEKWASQEALELHSSTPHMAEFLKKVAALREEVRIRSGTEAF